MSAQRTIVVSEDPKGHFTEGYLKPGQVFYPGMLVCIDPSMTIVNGRPGYKIWDGAQDGERGEIIVVRENELFGGSVDDAWPDSAYALLYLPVRGDEIQVLFKNLGTGTGAGQEDVTAGDKLVIDDGTGKVIATTGSPEDEPFVAQETISNITEDILVLVRVAE